MGVSVQEQTRPPVALMMMVCITDGLRCYHHTQITLPLPYVQRLSPKMGGPHTRGTKFANCVRLCLEISALQIIYQGRHLCIGSIFLLVQVWSTYVQPPDPRIQIRSKCEPTTVW
jgi:hypothetical protein